MGNLMSLSPPMSTIAIQRARPSFIALSQHFRRRPPLPPSIILRSLRHGAIRRLDEQKPNTSSSISAVLSSGKRATKHTRDELLAATSSLYKRFAIRFRWFAIRGFRPYRVDDWSAFFSWVLGGVGIWFVVGTTSFMASIFFLLNSLQMQEWLASRLGSYLTASSGVTVVFENAIVPQFSWRESKISFKNVYIYRGPEKLLMAAKNGKHQYQLWQIFDKSSGTFKLPADASVEVTQQSPFGKTRGRLRRIFQSAPIDTADSGEGDEKQARPFDEKRMMEFHLAIDSIDVTLSFPRWLDGKGIIKAAAVRGVRGVIDRSRVVWDRNAIVDRNAYRHKSRPGDFHLEGCTVEDFLVTVKQPNDFRPYTFSVFSAQMATLRKQWLFYDLLSAESITGQLDNCLFSLHRPQSIGRTNLAEDAAKEQQHWQRMSRFRIDGVNIDHLQSPRDAGALAWITSGKCDLVADVRFPRLNDDDSLEAIIGNIADRFDEVVLQTNQKIPGHRTLTGGQAIEAPASIVTTRKRLGLEETDVADPIQDSVVTFDLSIRFKDIKASLPLFPSDLSYVNYALVRPIVAFLNANRTLIPLKCWVALSMSDFDGSWTTYDTGILDAVSESVYQALAYHIRVHNDTRAKQVGLWSLQVLSKTALNALRAFNEPQAAQMKESNFL